VREGWREKERERERGRGEERDIFFRAATKRTPNRIKFAGPQTNNEAHPTLSLSSNERSPSDAQIRKESERGLSTSGLSFEPKYRQGWFKVQAHPSSFSSRWLTTTYLFGNVSSLLLRRED
jgi:hypothetical protein